MGGIREFLSSPLPENISLLPAANARSDSSKLSRTADLRQVAPMFG
jgi:hypothetical protein